LQNIALSPIVKNESELMKTFLTVIAAAALTLSASAQAAAPISLTEGFDNVAQLDGWVLNNVNAGATSWFQGNTGIFDAQAGAAASYAAASLTAGQAPNGAIDNWLITPEITLTGATRITFYTRNAEEGTNDTLGLLFSAGAGTSITGFKTSLLSIDSAAYPGDWTRYTADFTGTGTGRFAFHYTGNFEDSGYIGIDSVSIAAVPEPSTWLMMGLGLAGVGFMARRSRRAAAGAGLALAALGMSGGAMAADEKGMVVVRDAETGQLRAPTAAEYKALVPQTIRSSSLAAGNTKTAQVVTRADGTRVASAASKVMYSVVTKNADGTLSEACAADEHVAHAHAHAASQAHVASNNPRAAQAKERNYEAQ
jgi:hypothetical protein